MIVSMSWGCRFFECGPLGELEGVWMRDREFWSVIEEEILMDRRSMKREREEGTVRALGRRNESRWRNDARTRVASRRRFFSSERSSNRHVSWRPRSSVGIGLVVLQIRVRTWSSWTCVVLKNVETVGKQQRLYRWRRRRLTPYFQS